VISMSPDVSTNLRNNFGWASPTESLQSFCQLAVQKAREHRQGQVKIYV
jgi:hypothetical protein